MNPAVPRIPWVRGLQSLHLASAASMPRAVAGALTARTISTTAAQRDATDWLRKKLWKDGQAPGPSDPYTQRSEPSLLGPDAVDEVEEEEELLELRLPLPPRQRMETPTVKDITETHPSYQPAESLEDLSETTTVANWWEQPGHWGETDQFRGFGGAEEVSEKAAIQVYLRRALVEALALQQTGGGTLGEWATRKWAEGSREQLDAALSVNIVVKEGGEPVLKGNAVAVAESVKRESLPDEEAESAPPARISGPEATEIIKAWDASWKEIMLNDEMKFVLRKRLYQLTGKYIPDAKLGAAKKIRHLIALSAKKPKSLPLAKILEDNPISHMAHVKVHSRKVGMINHEISIGRWKIIEEELRKRNLPIFESYSVTKSEEKERLKGKM